MARTKGFNNIPAAMRALPDAAERLVFKVSGDIAIGAAAEAPIDTGALAESYTWVAEGLDGVAGTNIEYAPYVEYGTRFAGAQPHLVPAADAVEKSMRLYAGEMGDEIEERTRRG